MQALAASLRQSETAFLLESEAGWLLRWFTPRCEVPLCGHATLAALLALAHWGRVLPGQTTQLHSRSGPLEVGLPIEQSGWGTIVLPSSGLRACLPPASLSALLEEQLLSPPLGYWSSDLGYCVALLPEEAPLEAMASPAERLEGRMRATPVTSARARAAPILQGS
jgi:predicted PhzF superfamily epimerase YddE/YHI9